MSSAAAPRSLAGTVLLRRWRVVRKLLRAEFVSDGHVRSRFLDEARTSIRLVHPNIARVLECAQAEDGTPFLVMDLLEGVPLGAYTHNGGRVPVPQAVPILQGVLAGLAAAHAAGVIHRDLKPDNVMLTRDASGAFTVKVLDFGIAKVMDVAGGLGTRTRTGALLGTPAFMSPEQTRSARDVDQRSDLWSAGVLLYEMLTGREAFPGATDFARLAAVTSTDPEPIDRVDPALAPLAPFMAKALKKDRNERFGSAQEMAHALTSAVPNLGLRPSGAPQPLARLPEQVPLNARLPPEPGSVPTTMPAAGAPAPAPVSPPAPVPIVIAAPLVMPSPVPPRPGSGDTLASRGGPTAFTDPPTHIEIPSLLPFSGTLQSKGVRQSYAPRRSVGVGLVVVLVGVALVAGFLLGWATATAMR